MKKVFKLTVFSFILMGMLLGCSKNESHPKDVDLHEMLTTILKSEELPDMMEVEEEMLQDFYYFSSEDAKQVAIAMPLMNVTASEIMLVEANEGHLDAIKEGISKRLETLDGIWSRYLPDQYELVQNAQVVEVGNYYCVIIAENAEELAKSIKEALQ